MARTKEQLLQEKENIKKNMEKTKERRLKRLEEIEEELKALENKKWKPEYNEDYYYIDNSGYIYATLYNSNIDEKMFLIGNHFKTREEAEFEVERLKVLEELKEFSYEFSDEEWHDRYIAKYFIFYAYFDFTVEINFNTSHKMETIYFKTEEDAKKAIEKIGEERLKKYYFKVGNNE